MRFTPRLENGYRLDLMLDDRAVFLVQRAECTSGCRCDALAWPA